MFSYFPHGITDATPELVINIDFLQFIIQNNPKKDIIQKLWTYDYGSKEYSDLKNTLPYITPHGTFQEKRKNANIKKFSRYLYFDIDIKFINCDIEEYKKLVIDRYKEHICMAGKSVGGRGLFFYIKIKDPGKLTVQNFKKVFEYYRVNIFKDLPIDNKATGISRPQFIPYDPQLYINNDIESIVPEHVFNNHIKSEVKDICAGQYNKPIVDVLSCSAHSFQYLDINDILKVLIKETYVDVGDEDFIIKPVLYAKLYVPEVIHVGNRHRTYRAMMNAIVHNNPDFTLQQVASFINFINYYRTDYPLPQKELIRTVTEHYNKIKRDGIKGLDTRWVHTNPNLPGTQRSNISNRENGKLRADLSITLIKKVVDYLREEHITPTIKKVAEVFNSFKSERTYYRCERTIKTHWRRVVPKSSLNKKQIIDISNHANNAENARA